VLCAFTSPMQGHYGTETQTLKFITKPMPFKLSNRITNFVYARGEIYRLPRWHLYSE